MPFGGARMSHKKHRSVGAGVFAHKKNRQKMNRKVLLLRAILISKMYRKRKKVFVMYASVQELMKDRQ